MASCRPWPESPGSPPAALLVGTVHHEMLEAIAGRRLVEHGAADLLQRVALLWACGWPGADPSSRRPSRGPANHGAKAEQVLHQRRQKRPRAAGSWGPQSTLNANDYHIDQTSRCVSRARMPGLRKGQQFPILPPIGALDRPASSAAMDGGHLPPSGSRSSAHNRHGIGSHDCETP